MADPDLLARGIAEFSKALKDSPFAYLVFSHVGSSSAVDAVQAVGVFPSRNYIDAGCQDYTPIGPEAMAEYKVRRNNCFGCPRAAVRSEW